MLTAPRRLLRILPFRRHKFHTHCANYGYIVLVPEIGEEGVMNDKAMKSGNLPAFNDVTIENCLGAIGRHAGALENVVKSIENKIETQREHDQKLNVGEIFRELDEVSSVLETTWGVAKAIYLGNSTLIPTKTYMSIHERARSARSSKFFSKTLYQALQSHNDLIVQSDNEKRLISKYLLEGNLNGLGLSNDKREELKSVLLMLNKERTIFKNKVNVSTHSFAHVVNDYGIVKDFPPMLLEAMSINSNGTSVEEGPWRFSLQPQIVECFLKYCPDRLHRWNIWQANVRKASLQVNKSLENSTHLEKIRGFRKQQAKILGFPNFATMSLETKMISSIAELKEVFSKLHQFAKPAQDLEIAELQRFATNFGFQHKLEVYDVNYWQYKYLLNECQLDEKVIRNYFPIPQVLTALFALCETLYHIKIVERVDAQVWQPKVKYFDVYDSECGDKPIGGFYIDCYSSENRFGKNNGWMVSIRNRNDSAQLTPLCAIIFNFPDTETDRPYLLTQENLHLIFKTFGSALQHILTKANYSDLAGLSNVEWDASQVAGCVMENFLNNPKILQSISAHVYSGEQLPNDLANKIPLFHTHLAGYRLCEELYYADLDIELHTTDRFWLDVVRELWPHYRCVPLDKKDNHPCSYTEIFSGDWAAAQYSHLYSKIIAADITAAFEQQPNNLSTVGKSFKETFLSLGGSVPATEVFRRFRGRNVSVDAFLHSLKLA